MLPKNLRLDPKDIPFVARKGKKSENDFFILRAWFDDSLDFPKFAISISVKIDKRAVVRNRIKRKLRAVIIELIAEDYNFRKAKYLVIVRKKKLMDTDNSVIATLLKNML